MKNRTLKYFLRWRVNAAFPRYQMGFQTNLKLQEREHRIKMHLLRRLTRSPYVEDALEEDPEKI